MFLFVNRFTAILYFSIKILETNKQAPYGLRDKIMTQWYFNFMTMIII